MTAGDGRFFYVAAPAEAEVEDGRPVIGQLSRYVIANGTTAKMIGDAVRDGDGWWEAPTTWT